MDTSNAFRGTKIQPSEAQLLITLGRAATAWNELIAWLGEQGIGCGEWKSISPKYGWSLRPAIRKRTIVHLGPGTGCFRALFLLGERAVKAAEESRLPQPVLEELAGARRYAEGTGLAVTVTKLSDLDSVRTLVGIKLSN